ncbi:T9SS type A sorting domain-containing protein [Ginsengibacter hankyongi]|uniref:T9SS type A sorting domain-containing protein n=1 Tax=Ginsengibacter hankyongi TaxID=2607284 RepID=A0A5J5IHI8_9BACT|nr:T9SS type A sorting domain-containing protein [Ginsengibacter hankyongi]KAA9038121.1 T9SS type A sorting domain-containing protein [Ginsengibacter hankyongi]
MKTLFSKRAFLFCLVAFFTVSVNAQFTETFESQTPFQNTFNSNGQAFSLTNAFTIYSSRSGFGYQHSNRFVDNSNLVATNQANSIKTTNATAFTVKDFWLYVSADGGNNPSADGSIIITGKLAGVTRFAITKTAGFGTSFVPDNGFSNIDLTTEGGVDNSNIPIDEIEFQLQGNFNYIGIDNFTWAPQLVLPISLISYSATLSATQQVVLNWQMANGNNTSQFIIKKSSDGRNFKEIGSVSAAGNNNAVASYNFIDASPFGSANYYLLAEVDKDGQVRQLGVKQIILYNRFSSASMYPNPVAGSSFTLHTSLSANTFNSYLITDISGRIVQKGDIIATRQKIDVPTLATGSYTIQLSDGEVIKWIRN